MTAEKIKKFMDTFGDHYNEILEQGFADLVERLTSRLNAETENTSKFDRWPLRINAEMDKAAVEEDLSHWSCVDPNESQWWVRQDGMRLNCHWFDDWIARLRQFDQEHPMAPTKEEENMQKITCQICGRKTIAYVSENGQLDTEPLKKGGWIGTVQNQWFCPICIPVADSQGEPLQKKSRPKCKTPDNIHEPDWSTITAGYADKVWYIDVNCIHCGQSGCVGTSETLYIKW